MKKKIISNRKNEKSQILSWNRFSPHLWNIKCPIVERMSKSFFNHQPTVEQRLPYYGTVDAQPWNNNNDVSHDRQPLIRVIAQMWNSCSTLGVQNLANSLSWNHVNSLNRRIKKNTTFL